MAKNVKETMHSHDKLQLELFDLEEIEQLDSLPWRGVAPRVLTKAFQKFSLGAHPPGGLHAE